MIIDVLHAYWDTEMYNYNYNPMVNAEDFIL